MRSGKLWTLVTAAAVLALVSSPSWAASVTWNGSTSTDWSNAANWTSGDGTNVAPTAGDDVVLVGGGTFDPTNQDIGGLSIATVTFASGAGYTVGGSDFTVTSSTGVTVASGAGTATIGVNLTTTGAQSWSIASGSTLTTSGTITGDGTGILTVQTDGDWTVGGAVSLGAGRVVKNGDGVLLLNATLSSPAGNENFTSNAGTVRLGIDNALPASYVMKDGTFDLNGHIQNGKVWAFGGVNQVMYVEGSGASFIGPSNGSATTSDNAFGVVINAPTGAANWNLYGAAAIDITFNGVVSGTGGMTLWRGGEAALYAANTFTGQLYIHGDTVIANTVENDGTACSLGAQTGASAVIKMDAYGSHNGTLRWVGTTAGSTNRPIEMADTTAYGAELEANGSSGASVTFAGTITPTGAASKTLVLSGTNADANTISGVISDYDATRITSVAKSGSGKWVLSGPNTFTGSVSVDEGVLVADDDAALGVGGAVTVGGGTLNIAASRTISNPITMTSGALDLYGATAGVLDLSGGSLTVYDGGVLGGTGTIAVGFTLPAEAMVSPGASPGTQTYSADVDFDGTYYWELGALKDNSDGTGGTDWDLIVQSANTLTVGSTAYLTIDLSGVDGPGVDSFWDSDRVWTIIDVTGSGATSDNFLNVQNDWGTYGTFSTSASGGDIELELTYIPEPVTLLSVGAVLVALVGGIRTRRSLISL